MTGQQENLRYSLRAYEAANACRLAGFLLELTTEPPQPIDRQLVVDYWTERYPRHTQSGSTVRNRIGKALTLLRGAGIAQPCDDEHIEVLNTVRLAISAGNLAIVEDAGGNGLPPHKWASRPVAPEYLLATQAELELQRQANLQQSNSIEQ